MKTEAEKVKQFENYLSNANSAEREAAVRVVQLLESIESKEKAFQIIKKVCIKLNIPHP